MVLSVLVLMNLLDWLGMLGILDWLRWFGWLGCLVMNLLIIILLLDHFGWLLRCNSGLCSLNSVLWLWRYCLLASVYKSIRKSSTISRSWLSGLLRSIWSIWILIGLVMNMLNWLLRIFLNVSLFFIDLLLRRCWFYVLEVGILINLMFWLLLKMYLRWLLDLYLTRCLHKIYLNWLLLSMNFRCRWFLLSMHLRCRWFLLSMHLRWLLKLWLLRPISIT